MTATYKILDVRQSAGSASPGGFIVQGDHRQIFNGRVQSIPATTFEVLTASGVRGKYTVFTETPLLKSSELVGEDTFVRVNEIVPASIEKSGTIRNCSTFRLFVVGDSDIVLDPTTYHSRAGLNLAGKNAMNAEESTAQNFVRLAQNFAGSTIPSSPLLGQTWYDTDDRMLMVFDEDGWTPVNKTAFAPRFAKTHRQIELSKIWKVQHDLNLPDPFICAVQVFRTVNHRPKLILPADIEFVDANNLEVRFTHDEAGYVVLHA